MQLLLIAIASFEDQPGQYTCLLNVEFASLLP